MIDQMKQARQAACAFSSALLSPAHMLGSALKAHQPPTSPVRSPVPFSLSRHAFDDPPDNHDDGCQDDDYQGDQGDAASDDASTGDAGGASAEETVSMEPAGEGDSAEKYRESTAGEKEEEEKTVPSPVRSSSPNIAKLKEAGLVAPPEAICSGVAADEKQAAFAGGKGAVDVSSLHREVRRLIEAQVVQVLNTGSVAQLRALHGVGPKRAQYIVGKPQPPPADCLRPRSCA